MVQAPGYTRDTDAGAAAARPAARQRHEVPCLRALLSVSDREGIIELDARLQEAGISNAPRPGRPTPTWPRPGIEVEPHPRPGRCGPPARGRASDATAATRSRPSPSATSSRWTSWSSTSSPRPPEPPTDLAEVALLRAAATNHASVAAVSSPTQYASVLRDVKRDQAVSAGDPPEARGRGVRA